MVRECFDNSDEIISEGDSLVNATASAANAHRNFYVHSSVFPIVFKDGPKDFLMKFSARKGGLKVTIQKPDADTIDEITKEIEALVKRWNLMRIAMVQGIEVMNFADGRS